MKVDSSPGLRGPAPTRRGDRAAARGGEFARHLEDAGATSSGAPVAGVAGATGVASILSLQEVDDATTGRRQAVLRAQTLLDRLDELRHGLLMGTLSRSQLGELARLVGMRRGQVQDPRLQALLDDVDLRVQVEIAKYDVGTVG
ncbi:MAG: flagellar assembly protein FliX [Alphaproteobacteria bacterium]|nr:flagellar assembly protein FliX [Alphaproteobacteria bacterium]